MNESHNTHEFYGINPIRKRQVFHIFRGLFFACKAWFFLWTSPLY